MRNNTVSRGKPSSNTDPDSSAPSEFKYRGKERCERCVDFGRSVCRVPRHGRLQRCLACKESRRACSLVAVSRMKPIKDSTPVTRILRHGDRRCNNCIKFSETECVQLRRFPNAQVRCISCKKHDMVRTGCSLSTHEQTGRPSHWRVHLDRTDNSAGDAVFEDAAKVWERKDKEGRRQHEISLASKGIQLQKEYDKDGGFVMVEVLRVGPPTGVKRKMRAIGNDVRSGAHRKPSSDSEASSREDGSDTDLDEIDDTQHPHPQGSVNKPKTQLVFVELPARRSTQPDSSSMRRAVPPARKGGGANVEDVIPPSPSFLDDNILDGVSPETSRADDDSRSLTYAEDEDAPDTNNEEPTVNLTTQNTQRAGSGPLAPTHDRSPATYLPPSIVKRKRCGGTNGAGGEKADTRRVRFRTTRALMTKNDQRSELSLPLSTASSDSTSTAQHRTQTQTHLLSSLQNRFTSLKYKVASREKCLASAEYKLSSSRNALDSSQIKLEAAKTALAAAQAEVASARTRVVVAQRKVDEYDEELWETKGELAKCGAMMVRAKREEREAGGSGGGAEERERQ